MVWGQHNHSFQSYRQALHEPAVEQRRKLIYALTEDDREKQYCFFLMQPMAPTQSHTGQRATYALEVNTATGNLLALMF